MQGLCVFYVAFVMIFVISLEATDCLPSGMNSTDSVSMAVQDLPNDYVQNAHVQTMMQEASGSIFNFAAKYPRLVVFGLMSAVYGGFVFDAYRKHDEWFWFAVFLPLILPLNIVLGFYDSLSRIKH